MIIDFACSRSISPEREAAQRDRQRLAAGVPRLTGEHRQEDGEHHDAIERLLEDADHAGGDERGEEIELQPGVAEAEAARPGGGDALLRLDADHLSGLRREIQRLLLEDASGRGSCRPACLRVGHRIGRVVLRDDRLGRLEHGHVGLQGHQLRGS